MHAITGRITVKGDLTAESARQKLLACIHWMGGTYLIVREWAPEAGDHYHYILETPKEVKQMRNVLQRHFGKVGNGVLSCKLVKQGDIARARRYLCKGDATHPDPRGNPPHVVQSYGGEYTRLKIDEYHEAYWRQSAEVRANQNLSFTDQVLFEARQKGTCPSVREVAAIVVRLSVEQKRTLNAWH